jgi:hypothetical protein
LLALGFPHRHRTDAGDAIKRAGKLGDAIQTLLDLALEGRVDLGQGFREDVRLLAQRLDISGGDGFRLGAGLGGQRCLGDRVGQGAASASD